MVQQKINLKKVPLPKSTYVKNIIICSVGFQERSFRKDDAQNFFQLVRVREPGAGDHHMVHES